MQQDEKYEQRHCFPRRRQKRRSLPAIDDQRRNNADAFNDLALNTELLPETFRLAQAVVPDSSGQPWRLVKFAGGVGSHG
jgi:hypothetical protein